MIIEIKSEEHAKEISKLSYLEKLSQLKHVYEIEAHVLKLSEQEKEFYGVSVYDHFFSLHFKIRTLKKQLGMFVGDVDASTYYNYKFGTYKAVLFLASSFRKAFYSAFKSKNRKRITQFNYDAEVARLSPNVYFQGVLLTKKYNYKLNKRTGNSTYFTAPNLSKHLKENFICNFNSRKEIATVISHITGKNYVKVYKTIKKQGKFFTYNNGRIQTFNYFKNFIGGYTLIKGIPKFETKKHLFLFETEKDVEDFKKIISEDVAFVNFNDTTLFNKIVSDPIKIFYPTIFLYVKERFNYLASQFGYPFVKVMFQICDSAIIVQDNKFSLLTHNNEVPLGGVKDALKRLKINFLDTK